MSALKNLPFEWLIGLRYTRAGKRGGRNTFISFISLISMAGIALGVAALIIVLSVMNGFEKEVRNRMLSVVPHIEIFNAWGALPDYRATAAEALRNKEVVAATPYVAGEAMITREDTVRGVMIRGVSPQEEAKVSPIATQVKQGRFDELTADSFNIVLGVELAHDLGATVGGKVNLIASEGNVASGQALPHVVQMTVAGIFDTGHHEYDSTLAFVHIDDAMKLFKLAGPSGLQLKVADMQRAPQVAASLSRTLSGDLYIRDWSKQDRIWFSAVESQKNMMFIILALIIAVAAFNLVSTLVMTVTDKQADIAILRTLGASPRSVMKIFVVQGALVGVIGTLIGIGVGIAIALNVDVIVPVIEHLLGMKFISKDVYLIDTLPSALRWKDVWSIGGVALFLALTATLYPSWRAARVKPADALRYE
jgi:lipoprotein-releasing system permease protein